MNHVSLNGLIGWLLKQTLNPVRTNQLAASITTLVLGSWATNYDERGIGGEGRGWCWDHAEVMAEKSAWGDGIVMRHSLIQAKISTCQQSTNCPLRCPNTFAARDFHFKQHWPKLWHWDLELKGLNVGKIVQCLHIVDSTTTHSSCFNTVLTWVFPTAGNNLI